MARGVVVVTAFALSLVLAGARADAEEAAVRLRAVLVLDASQSMDEQDPGRLAEVAAHLLVDLATPLDEVTVVRFGTGAERLGREVVRDGAARDRLHEAIGRVARTEWCTDYRVGLEAALEALPAEASPGERRLVIFLTDGLYDPDRSNEAYYRTDEGRQALERARAIEGFAERSCARRHAPLGRHVEPAFLERMGELDRRFARSGVRLYTVGLGPALSGSGEAAARSRSLLERLASSTGGSFLAATSSSELPGFFASIYSALVGAPVEPRLEAPEGEDRLEVQFLAGASRVALVVDAGSDLDLRVGLRPLGQDGAPAHDARSRHAPIAGGEGYRVLSFDAPEPGGYVVVREAGRARLRVQLIQEVGLRLVVSGLPEVAPEGSAPRVTMGLRSSAGEPLRLSAELLRRVRFTMTLRAGDETVVERRLAASESAEAAVGLEPLGPGRYVLEVRATHEQGLLEVEPTIAEARVVHQLEPAFERARIVFDTMAEEGASLEDGARVVLAEGAELPIEQAFEVDWSGVSGRQDLVLEPARVVLGPDRREAPLAVRLREPRAMRGASREYRGEVALRPVQPELYRGEAPSFLVAELEGRVRPWTLGRYYRQYWPWLWGSLAALLLALSALGRAVASSWPRAAKLHYVELDDPTRSETEVLLRRGSRSRLPFRSDRHRCGRGGLPGKKGKKRYCELVASGAAGFVVVPRDVAVVRVEGGEEVSSRRPFRGTWEDRYRLGDRFEIWLTRT